MNKSLATLTLLAVATGCRTSGGSGVKEDVKASSAFSCKMVSPDTSGENLVVLAESVSGGQMTNAKTRYMEEKDGPVKETDHGTLRAIDPSLITKRGQRSVRTYFKDIVDIDYKNYDCFQLTSDAASKNVAFFCIQKGAGERDAFVATNMSGQKYAFDLTMFGAKCGG